MATPKDELNFSEDFEIRDELLQQLLHRIRESDPDTRAALSDYTLDADEHQTKVIHAVGKVLRLVAPAGSGKTQTIVNRILRMVRDGVKPNRLLVLTFDNAAAKTLRERFIEQTTKIGIPHIFLERQVTTLNAFGYHLLRQFFPQEFKQVATKSQTGSLIFKLKDALHAQDEEAFDLLPSDLKPSYYFEFFSLLKNELFDPRSIDANRFAEFILKNDFALPFLVNSAPNGDSSSRSFGERVRKLIRSLRFMFQGYDAALARMNVIDFDDQKLRAFRSLEASPEKLVTVQGTYDEIIVDEFQDVNRLDFSLVKLIAKHCTLLVVGDDDQAIYGFRGCSPEYIINLKEHLGRLEGEFELSTNYRCPPNIVDHANCLIRFNHNRISKNPVSASSLPAAITVESTATAGLEAKYVVEYIRKIREANPNLSFSNFAILYRTNAQSLPLQVEFILNDIPYYVREEDNILENEVLAKFLAVLRVRHARRENELANPRDVALMVASYFKWVGATELEKLERLFQKRDNIADVLRSNEFFWILPRGRTSNCAQAVEGLLKTSGRLSRVITYLASEFKGFRGILGSLEEVVENRVPLGEIFDLAANHKGRETDFLLSIESAVDRAKQTHAGRADKEGVALLTYFKAKGRQWHTVVLTTCNNGLIPHSRANVEDERRLFYVAMTRASANLLLSYVGKSCNNKVSPSRFLQEAGLR